MAGYDSDSSMSSSGGDSSVSTSVILGYASKDPTGDNFSQLGGHPSFFDGTYPQPALVKCKCCNSNMSLLLQLHGDIKFRFPTHERRLYLWTCRQKQCRRKDGSIRGIRGIRVSQDQRQGGSQAQTNGGAKELPSQEEVKRDFGSELFGAKQPATTSGNPFSTSSSSPIPFSNSNNPLSAAPAPPSTLAAKSPQTPSGNADSDFSATFAQKARISSPPPEASTTPVGPKEPWPEVSAFPTPYPSYHLDADTEYLSPTSESSSKAPSASHAAFMDVDGDAGSSSAQSSKDDAEAEMTIDKAFQSFADRVAQNDEQILRYEFGGTPLLYSRTDAVGRLFSQNHAQNAGAKVTTTGQGSKGMPRCRNCGANRVFELQLMPQAIADLEVDEDAASLLANGMDWGTILFGVCEKDCTTSSQDPTSYVEEWVGVQWEEVVKRRK